MNGAPRRFRPGFLWGAATSAHQVEGGNRWNDWWEYEQQGRVPFRSGDACRHYERYARDFDLARSWGHNAHRLSIEWSRVEPAEGQWNGEAVAHYRDVIRALRDRALEPVVTLHHFTNPAWFTRRGGWARRDAPPLFARYVRRVAQAIGGDVRYWVTVNEPTVLVMQGYVTGEWPPCERGAWLDAGRALWNLARAHVAAYRALHAERPGVMVGFAHNAPVVVACNPRRRRDRIAAAVRDYALNRLFFQLIGARASKTGRRGRTRGALDFVGVNYYTRNFVRGTGEGLGALVGRVCESPHHDRGPLSAMGWEMFPDGLRVTIERAAEHGLPVLVTENGIATSDEDLRRRFLVEHVAAAAKAAARGVDLIGYLYWSLIDNFEWAHGTAPRFGLAAVDYETQARQPRPCAEVFSRIIRENQSP